MTDQASGEVSSIDPQGGVRPEEPSGSLEDLLAVIAHEIRSPLSVVRTAAETAVERDLPPDRLRKLLEIIRRNANLAMLVTDRLALARDVEMGAFALDPVEVDLVALTRETVSDLALSIPGGGGIRCTWLAAARSPCSRTRPRSGRSCSTCC